MWTYRASKLLALFNANSIFSGYIGDVLLRFFAELKGEDVEFRELPSDQINLKLFDVAEWLFVLTHKQILQLQETSRDGLAAAREYEPILRKLDEVNPDPLQPPSTPSPREQLLWECCFMLEMGMEMWQLINDGEHAQGFLPLDSFTKAMFEITKVRRNKIKKMQEPIPVWLCFAARVFIDIHVTLGGDSGQSSCGLQELKIAGMHPQAAIDKHLAFQGDKRSPSWTDACELGITQTSEHIKTWILKDRLTENSTVSFLTTANQMTNQMTNQSTILCGLIPCGAVF